MTSNSTYIRNFQMIMHRPFEPAFSRKGPNGERFNLPRQYFGPRYADISDELIELHKKVKSATIPVKDVQLPDLKFASRLGVHDMFSPLIPVHRKIADALVDILLKSRDLAEFQSVALYMRDRVNAYCFNYVMTIALHHRPDTRFFNIPNLYEVFPEKFIAAELFAKIRQESGAIPLGSRLPVVQPFALTAKFSNVEQKCFYFREDFLLNLSYWDWNIMYPACISNPAVLNKDRRGELYFYYHHQILARYNSERFCNNMNRVEPLCNLREPIHEGYFSKLDSQVGGNAFPPRCKNSTLNDLRREREELHLDLYTLERWIDRIYDAISVGFIINDKGERVSLKDPNGINILGDIMQCSMSSPNRYFYGDLGRMGKLFMAYCHDCHNKHLESFGVLADDATALRDPLFYRWHARLNDLFMLHKDTLAPYTTDELTFKGITLESLQLEKYPDNDRENELLTHWQQVDADTGPGLNFSSSGGVYVRLTHLDHRPYTIKLQIQNSTRKKALVCVRLFLLPEYNEYGLRMNYNELRKFAIEIDRFATEVKPGLGEVNRKSEDSTVVRLSRKKTSNTLCRAGWPAHLLIPKGDDEGKRYILYAILTDYNKDTISKATDGNACNVGSLYYGMYKDTFPDKKPMGFPFDRRAPFQVEQLSDFMLPNMKSLNITIRNKRDILPPKNKE